MTPKRWVLLVSGVALTVWAIGLSISGSTLGYAIGAIGLTMILWVIDEVR